MRIALTYNLRLSDAEEEAEFDTAETVNTLAGAIERLGHRLERVEVSGPASRIVARLEAYSPDLIFNTAEGRRGRFREAFYPALFDELGIPYTGSDAYALAVTLDKQLTKLMLREHGVRTPGWQYVEHPEELNPRALRFPVIVKPNFEGSSKGITQDSVAETPEELEEKVASALERYPAGVLVEEYVAGRDITVPYLAAVQNDFGGVLSPVEYVIDAKLGGARKYSIYDYALKTTNTKAVKVRAPADLSQAMSDELREIARKIFRVCDCHDLGRLDFRVSEEGGPHFLEINALPSLEPGAGIYVAAELEGLHLDRVIDSIIESAAKRNGIKDSPRRQGKPTRKSGPLRVWFAYNVKRIKPTADAQEDSEAWHRCIAAFDRASHGDGGAGALSRHRGDHRPRYRGWILLRLRAQSRSYRSTTCRRSRPKMQRAGEGRPARCIGPTMPQRRGHREVPAAGREVQGRDHSGIADGPGFDLQPGRVDGSMPRDRTCPRPAISRRSS